jgi:hypothetical protein
MFCPVCKDEFRPGFTRCAGCDVDLVESLEPGGTPSVAPGKEGKPAPAVQLYVPMVEYCGFLGLEEARAARDRLKEERIRSEIVIREAPASLERTVVEEEFWLRVERDRYKEAAGLLGFDEAPSAGGESFQCDQCGTEVAAQETFCPECGAHFEDD